MTIFIGIACFVAGVFWGILAVALLSANRGDGELVRCKDCLHNRACEIQYHAQAGDLFFCGAAERKDGDGNG